MLGGNLRADIRDARFDVRRLDPAACDRGADRPQQHVGQLERGGLGDVETVEKAVADEIEVGVHGLTGRAGERAQGSDDLPGIILGREKVLRGRVLPDRDDQRLELLGGTSGNR